MSQLDVEQIKQAQERIAPHIWATPLLHSHWLSDLTGGQVHLKLECRQRLGSFKVRGMVNRVLCLTADERRRGIVVASSGNHGVAASWAGHRWGIPVHVYVPATTPETKLAKIRRYGAALHLAGDNYDQAYLAARQALAAGAVGGVWVDSCSDPLAVAGHGTIGLEIAAALPEAAEVLVPIGGGGLITGIGAALRAVAPAARVSGVQTAACPAMAAAIRDGVFYETYPADESVCEALIGGVGELAFREHARCIDRVLLAAEPAIEQAVADLLRHEQVLAEPSGAIGCAYIMQHAAEFAGRTVVVVVSGQNIGFALLRRLLARYGDEC